MPSVEGEILEGSHGAVPETVNVQYQYSEEGELTLKIQGVTMNAAARGVGCRFLLDEDTIRIWPHEIYDERGPVESTKWYTVRYVVTSIARGLYRIEHDDSDAEGRDRVVSFDVDLRQPATDTITVKPRNYYRVDLTPDNQWDDNWDTVLEPANQE